MTAQVLVLPAGRPTTTPPCGSGTEPGVFGAKVCGAVPARLFCCGWRCQGHVPANRKLDGAA